MKNLLEATEMICDLKGSQLALETLVTALLRELQTLRPTQLLQTFELHAEVARTVMLHTPISEHTLGAFERDVKRISLLISAAPADAEPVQAS
jgi:hypothetical protein